MAHIDTLEMYREYLGAGYSEAQAVTAVKALNSSFDGVATKQDLSVLEKDLKNNVKQQIKRSEYSLKSFVAKLIFGSLILGFILPKIASAFGW